MKKQANYSNVIINNFGQLIQNSTLELVEYKNKLIKSIMVCRFKLNYQFDMYMFDIISDMDIDELELLEMEYQEQIERFSDRRKHV